MISVSNLSLDLTSGEIQRQIGKWRQTLLLQRFPRVKTEIYATLGLIDDYKDILDQIDMLQCETRGEFINDLVSRFQENGFGRLIEKTQDRADYCIGDDQMLMRFFISSQRTSNCDDWKCVCQIFKYDEETGYEDKSLDPLEKDKLKKLISPIGFHGGWVNCPGVLDIGKVNFQRKEKLLNKACEIYEQLLAAIAAEMSN